MNLVVRHFGLGQQHVHVTWHAACHRVNGVLDGDALVGELLCQFLDRVLRTGHRQAVARHDDDRLGVAQDESGVIGRAGLDVALNRSAGSG